MRICARSCSAPRGQQVTLLELHREAASLETVFRNLTTHEEAKS